VLGRDELTAYLIWLAIGAALWGYVSARLDMSPWLAQAVGCAIGAFVVIEAVGSVLPNAHPSVGGLLQATADSVTQAYLDLTWRHQLSTPHYGHYCLVLGILVWGSAQAASYDVFAYHRSVNGVLLLAVVLIANMSLTLQDQFMALVLFSGAGLVLLLLAHAADERTSWQRHRIWRGRDFQAPHIQGGLAFAGAAVAGALVLTTVASSAPLGALANSINLQDSFGWLAGYLPNGGNSRYQPNGDFGSSSPIVYSFKPNNGPVFTVRVPSATGSFHWRMVAYDTFQTTGWIVGPNTQEDNIIAGGTIAAGTQDLVGTNTPGRTAVSIVVHIQDTSIKRVVVANEPDTINVPVRRMVVGGGPNSSNVVWLTTDATDYAVTAYAPNLDPKGAGLTEWRLRHAGANYPQGLQTRYTQGAQLVGSDGQALLNEIGIWAKGDGNPFDNEYDVAKAIQSYLRSEKFTYNTDITGLMPGCVGLSTVDCFAFKREGFCEQYATTMTMLMRMKGYPARYVLGYLPGPVDPNTLIQQVTSQQKHAWVEVFFPGYGWIPFDPTGGPGQPTVLTPGSAVVQTPAPIPSADPNETGGPGAPTKNPNSGGTDPKPGDGDGLVRVLVPSLLTGTTCLALLVLWRRRPRRLDEPDTVYRNVVKLASRMGYRPSPTQTVYEYTGMLADVLPEARDSLGVVATATVEVHYGRRKLGSDRLALVAAAQKRVRQALLGLVWRLPRLWGYRPVGRGTSGKAVKPKRRR
jgi:hypothetical protein